MWVLPSGVVPGGSGGRSSCSCAHWRVAGVLSRCVRVQLLSAASPVREAQLDEPLITNQVVVGSTPSAKVSADDARLDERRPPKAEDAGSTPVVSVRGRGMVPRMAHNHQAAGSSPVPAPNAAFLSGRGPVSYAGVAGSIPDAAIHDRAVGEWYPAAFGMRMLLVRFQSAR